MPEANPRRRLRLLDLAAMVVGFGMAALLVRAFWPASRAPTTGVGVVLALVYLWLGLAMSGPPVLLFDRRAAPPRDPADRRRMRIADRAPEAGAPGSPPRPGGEAAPPARYTRAELAWLAIGAYWFGMTALVVPFRAAGGPFLTVVGLLHVAVGLGACLFGPTWNDPGGDGPPWTHRTAVGLLMSWPLAWAGLILLTLS